MPTPRTVVTFQASGFNTSEPRDYFVNPGCFGDDVAHALMKQLRSQGIQTDAEPGQEDFGWFFGYRLDATPYHFVLGYRPEHPPDRGCWIGWIERNAGLIGSLFGARQRGIEPEAVEAIRAAVSSIPTVTEVRWHRRSDFDSGREEHGTPEPTAA